MRPRDRVQSSCGFELTFVRHELLAYGALDAADNCQLCLGRANLQNWGRASHLMGCTKRGETAAPLPAQDFRK